jgi:two-component system response regulator FlrC
MSKNVILVIEDDLDLRQALCDTLSIAGYATLEADSADPALQILETERVNLIISDVQMPGMHGDELLKTVKRKFPEIPFVLITAYGTVTKAVEAIQAGAADYIIKPFEAEVLIEMVDRLAVAAPRSEGMIMESKRSRELAELGRRVAATDVTVMISGESGCGKEVYSRYIHSSSKRSDKPFVAINCAAIPEPMLESMLFGYEKGAFTGAYTARAGKFEQANGGTLLLDEISEIDIGLQAKLLRVIQEKEVERLGGSKPIPLDVRIIATTNRNLKEEVTQGRFREDLFYRLNVFPLHLSPLRDRKEDILPLTRRFVENYETAHGIKIDSDAEEVLLRHTWPGNVRELENVIQRALILKSGTTVTAQDIIFETPNAVSTPSATIEAKPAAVLESDLKTREKEIIIDAVASHSSRKEAAEKLGISPRTLRYKLAQFRRDGITIPCFPNEARAS